jgi:hypothetical protein
MSELFRRWLKKKSAKNLRWLRKKSNKFFCANKIDNKNSVKSYDWHTFYFRDSENVLLWRLRIS